MNGAMKLIPNDDGSYDLIIQWNETDTEFAMDFMSRRNEAGNRQSISEFLASSGKNIKVNAVKIMVAGLVVASVPFASFILAAAEGDAKYSMTYLYSGTPQQHIEYVGRTNNSLQTVSPSYFDIKSDGSLSLNPVSRELVEQMHASDIKVVPFLSNHWDRNAGIHALKDVEALSDQIADYVETYHLDGVNVDIENVTHAEREQYTELVRLLRQKIPDEKEVSVAVAANPYDWQLGWHGSYDYTALAENSDYLMMMTYDEHYAGGSPGPVASIGFVENSIQYALSKTSADKIVVGLPFFGRIWSLDDDSVVGRGLGVEAINSMVKTYNGMITFDAESQSPKAEFEVKEGDSQVLIGGKALAPGRYVVWYENEQSIQEKLKLVQKYDLKGAGSWALGQEDTAIWSHYNAWLNGDTTAITPPTYPSTVGDHPGWTKDSIGWWLKTGENTYARNQWMEINGVWYYFNADGYMVTGWLRYQNKWYLLQENGDMATGWTQKNDKWYFLRADGDMATGWLKDNHKWYFLNADGDMAVGWKAINGKWYFLNENGDMATGWLTTGGKRYFLNEDGAMATGWKLTDGKWYYLNTGGEMAAGWLALDGRWYYLNAEGDMATGWITTGGKRYYLNQDGAMATGWIVLDGQWYFLNPNGDMATGWNTIGNRRYFLNDDGSMVTGWLTIDGSRYFFHTNGDMASGWVFADSKWYFLNGDGSMATGWIQENGIWYYLLESGEMNVDPLIYQDKEYLFQQNGACINPDADF